MLATRRSSAASAAKSTGAGTPDTVPKRAWYSEPTSETDARAGEQHGVSLAPGARHAADIGDEAHAADDGGRMDRAAVGVVVERDVARHDRDAERLGSLRHPLDRLGELPADLGLLGVAEVEAVGEAERLAADAGDVAGRLEDRPRTSRERLERTDTTLPVERERRGRDTTAAGAARPRRARVA